MDQNKNVIIVVGGVVGVVSLLLVTLLPLSFVPMEYYEMGFPRIRTTGNVDTSKVYTGGKYLLGPNVEFKVFNSSAHNVDLTNIEVFTLDKLEVEINIHFQYFLRKDELEHLDKQFDIYYEDVMKSSAVDAIKGAIPVYDTWALTTERLAVEEKLYRAVRHRLGGTCCRPNCDEWKYACEDDCVPIEDCNDVLRGLNADVKFFQLTGIVIPPEVQETRMQALVLKEEAARESLFQQARLVRQNTTEMVRDIRNQALEISEAATTEAMAFAIVAQANYTNIIEKARSQGLKNLFDSLGITEQDKKNSFNYLRTLRGMDNARFTVDFQQRIAGNL